MFLLPSTSWSWLVWSAWLLITVPAERLLHFRYEMHCQLFYLRWFTVSYFNSRLVQNKTSEKVSRCSWRSVVFSSGLGCVLVSFLFFPRLRALKTCEEALKFLLSSSYQVWEYLSPFQVHTDTDQHELLPGQMLAVESEPEEPGLQPSQWGETTCPRTGSCQPLIAEPFFDRQPLKWIQMFVFRVISLFPNWIRKAFIFSVTARSPRSIVLGNT